MLWSKAVSDAEGEFNGIYGKLSQARDQLGRLKADYDGEFRVLERTCEAQQLKVFLQSTFISDHRIDKIGPEREAVLASYGIETAYDVERNRILRISGFGPALTGSLVAWRRSIEAKFRFNPAQGIPPNERQSLNMKYIQQRQRVEAVLCHGPEELKAVIARAKVSYASIAKKISDAEGAVAQAEADLTVMA